MGNFFNAFMFNIAWFGLIIYGNIFIPVVLIWLALHFYYSNDRANEAFLIALVTFIGVGIDGTLSTYNVFDFNGGTFLVPLWLIFIWISFAATLRHSLSYFRTSKSLTLIIGFFIVPFSYIAGEKFGAVNFGFSYVETYFILGFIWGVLFNLFINLSTPKRVKYA